MSYPIRQFELTILRPIWFLTLIAVGLFLFKGVWLWLAGSIFALFYIGSIGAKLHPLQTFAELKDGPLKGPSAKKEAVSLSTAEQRQLVGYACTRVSIPISFLLGAFAKFIFSWRWYFVVPAACVVGVLMASTLKITFKTLPQSPNE